MLQVQGKAQQQQGGVALPGGLRGSGGPGQQQVAGEQHLQAGRVAGAGDAGEILGRLCGQYLGNRQ